MKKNHPNELKEEEAKQIENKGEVAQPESNQNDLRCEDCNATFDSQIAMKNHLKQHRCHICRKVFKTPLVVQLHIKHHYRLEKKSLKTENEKLKKSW